MSISTFRRNRARAGVRSTVGLLFVAMLGLAFQPCVMAMDMDTDHSCPHCPTKTGQGKHHQNAQLDGVADCDYFVVYNHDGRTAQSKVKDTLDNVPVVVDSAFSLDLPKIVVDVHKATSSCVNLSNGPPLNILYCIYLK